MASFVSSHCLQVESCHIAFMETGFDSRTQRLGDPVICTQLYFCGGTGDEQIERIMKRGFSKEGTVYLPNLTPWACVSHRRAEYFDLTLAHAYGPISHSWLKNVSYYLK